MSIAVAACELLIVGCCCFLFARSFVRLLLLLSNVFRSSCQLNLSCLLLAQVDDRPVLTHSAQPVSLSKALRAAMVTNCDGLRTSDLRRIFPSTSFIASVETTANRLSSMTVF